MDSKSVDAGRGAGWWTDSWALFMKNPGMWIVLGLIMIVIFVVLGVIPFLGTLLTSLVMPALVGGWMLAARKVESGGALEVGDLLLGFKQQQTPLLILGGLGLAATAAIVAVMLVLGLGAVMGVVMGGAAHSTSGVLAAVGAGLLALLVGLAMSVPVTMAFWFAPALVVFDGVAPVDALKASFAACLRNIVPFLLHGVILFLALIVMGLTKGLAGVLVCPLLLHSVYLSYRDIFTH